ncbi:aldo/keto reductase [Sporobolomyces salmoneus]|uniref:aldo/keto reductase n=1 Tax=Sporobolomyces salmoneus TaxID=183962 RepID=UPI003179FAC8
MSSTFSIDNQESWPRPGFGAMGLSAFYGPTGTDEDAKKVLRKAIEIGCTFWNTADMYGDGHNEKIIGEVLREGDNRSKVFLVTKFGNKGSMSSGYTVDGSPAYAREALEASISRLGGLYPDAWIAHRIDKNTPIEETVGAMEALRKEGKCKYIGLSECSAETLRKAAKVAKISFVEVEYSPWTVVMEQNGVLDACKELGITVLAYSPLGRGFLTGRYKKLDDFAQDDFRKFMPRFQAENWEKNYKIVDEFEKLASKKGCTPGQLSLAWLMAQGPNIVPIPGTKSEKYLIENFESSKISLNESELRDVRKVIMENQPEGGRYPEAFSGSLDE